MRGGFASSSSRVAIAAMVSLAAMAYFVVAVAVLHVLRADLDPTRRFLSQYALGPHGWLMATAFLSIGVACAALAFGLRRAGPRSGFATGGVVALAVAAGGVTLAAAFPMDAPGSPATRTGTIHVIDAQLNFTSLAVAALCFSVAFRRDERWRGRFRASLGLGLALVVSFAIMMTATGGYGLINRAMAGLIVAWLVTTARALREVTAGNGSGDPPLSGG